MQLPVIQPLLFVLSALSGLDIRINKAQVKNLALILTASRPVELPHEPLSERCGNLSIHTAPTKQPILSKVLLHS